MGKQHLGEVDGKFSRVTSGWSEKGLRKKMRQSQILAEKMVAGSRN